MYRRIFCIVLVLMIVFSFTIVGSAAVKNNAKVPGNQSKILKQLGVDQKDTLLDHQGKVVYFFQNNSTKIKDSSSSSSSEIEPMYTHWYSHDSYAYKPWWPLTPWYSVHISEASIIIDYIYVKGRMYSGSGYLINSVVDDANFSDYASVRVDNTDTSNPNHSLGNHTFKKSGESDYYWQSECYF